MTSRLLVIIPTYNEAENIEPILRAIRGVRFTDAPDILVVDDGSPDGTGALVDRLIEQIPGVFVLHREREPRSSVAYNFQRGLGPAYLAGFQWGLERGYNWLVEMDADFSHEPTALAEMEKLMQKNAGDVLIGSRYVPGGAIKNWGVHRRFISVVGNFVARVVLRSSLQDLTGGFNAWRSEVLRKIGLENISSSGYSFQIELKNQALQHGFRCVEFPIHFTERRVGKSKMSSGIVWEAIGFLGRSRR